MAFHEVGCDRWCLLVWITRTQDPMVGVVLFNHDCAISSACAIEWHLNVPNSGVSPHPRDDISLEMLTKVLDSHSYPASGFDEARIQ